MAFPSYLCLQCPTGVSRTAVEPGKLGGKPCVRGMRMSVADVLEYLAADMSIDEVLADFPYLEREDILACLA
jgi:uncharacterized protein (DUF433 family)